MLEVPRSRDEIDVLRKILTTHIISLFREREKVGARRSFIAVIRSGGFKVIKPRELKCCDIVLLETTLAPGDQVNDSLVRKCIICYLNWELGK